MELSNLIQTCVAILDEFNMNAQSVDSHVETFFANYAPVSEEDKIFIVEVFSGCVRFHKMISVVVEGFYNVHGRTILLSIENLFRVLTYLILLRLSELGIENFKDIIKTQKIHIMYKFLTFICDEKGLVTWMKDAWCLVYSATFVENEIVEPLMGHLPALHQFIQSMEDQIENKKKKNKAKVQATELKPFNLTQPRPRSVPMPELIPTVEPAHPVPDSTYEPPKTQDILDQMRIENRKRAELLAKEATAKQPKCIQRAAEKKSKQDEVLNAQKEDQWKQLQADATRFVKARPAPTSLKQQFPIKLNTAAILREWKRYKEKEDKDMRKLQDIEAGAFDRSQFEKWQESVRASDLASQLADLEKRRVAGQLSREEAILARRRLEEENRAAVLHMRSIMEQKFAELEKQRAVEEAQMKEIVERVMATHDQAKLSRKEVQQANQKLVREMQAAAREREELAMAEAEEEMRRKLAVISEIRALEMTAPSRGGGANLSIDRPLDQARTAGHGLLLEMSLMELKERLQMLKVQSAQQMEEKRDAILDAKQNKDQKLMDTLQTIARHRGDLTRKAAEKCLKKSASRDSSALIKTHLGDEKSKELAELKERLSEKRQERQVYLSERQERISGQNRAGSDMKKILAQKKQSEQAMWRELDRSKEKRVKDASQNTGSLVTRLEMLSA